MERRDRVTNDVAGAAEFERRRARDAGECEDGCEDVSPDEPARPDEEPGICGHCSGTGEGAHESVSCSSCRGTGLAS